MELITIFGFFGAFIVGLVLGLLGGGGSILTLPILVYLFQVDIVIATGYSLFIIGITSLVGTIRNAKKRQIDFKIGIVFTIPALIALYFTRSFIIPSIPEVIFKTESFELSKSMAIMLLFSIVMLVASYSMIKGRKENEDIVKKPKLANLIITGLGVGILSGLVGAGGGFIIIPALVFFAHLPMKQAVATSIFIIAINSLLGFGGDLGNYIIDWPFLLAFSTLSILGIFSGIHLNKFVSGAQLKRGFGYFVLIMGAFIILREIMF